MPRSYEGASTPGYIEKHIKLKEGWYLATRDYQLKKGGECDCGETITETPFVVKAKHHPWTASPTCWNCVPQDVKELVFLALVKGSV